MTNKPTKILVGIKAEQIKEGDPSFLVSLLSDFEKGSPEKVKTLRGSVSLMFPNVDEFPLAFLMWTLGLYAKNKDFAYFLDKESIDFINNETLKRNSKEIIKPDTFTCRAVDFGVRFGYTKEEMFNYFEITEEDYFSHPYNINKEEVLEKKCLCSTPLCAKCLSVNCVDKNCTTHTKEAKITWRKNWEANNKAIFPHPANY